MITVIINSENDRLINTIAPCKTAFDLCEVLKRRTVTTDLFYDVAEVLIQ